jgi:hypothetical protein
LRGLFINNYFPVLLFLIQHSRLVESNGKGNSRLLSSFSAHWTRKLFTVVVARPVFLEKVIKFRLKPSNENERHRGIKLIKMDEKVCRASLHENSIFRYLPRSNSAARLIKQLKRERFSRTNASGNEINPIRASGKRITIRPLPPRELVAKTTVCV